MEHGRKRGGDIYHLAQTLHLKHLRYNHDYSYGRIQSSERLSLFTYCIDRALQFLSFLFLFLLKISFFSPIPYTDSHVREKNCMFLVHIVYTFPDSAQSTVATYSSVLVFTSCKRGLHCI